MTNRRAWRLSFTITNTNGTVTSADVSYDMNDGAVEDCIIALMCDPSAKIINVIMTDVSAEHEVAS